MEPGGSHHLHHHQHQQHQPSSLLRLHHETAASSSSSTSPPPPPPPTSWSSIPPQPSTSVGHHQHHHDLLRPIPVGGAEEYDRPRWELGELEKRSEEHLLYLEEAGGGGVAKLGEHFVDEPERDERADNKASPFCQVIKTNRFYVSQIITISDKYSDLIAITFTKILQFWFWRKKN